MKAKYPKAVWVMLNNHEPYYVDKKESFSLTEGWSCVPYHLHPGNEVARALNVLSRTRKGILPYRYCAAEALRKAGFPVRWDVKAGRFV